MIDVSNISFQYNNANKELGVVLDNIDFKVNDGEFVAVLGHNGSGKSTLAKHLNAILLPNSGSVEIDGMDTKDEFHLWTYAPVLLWFFKIPTIRL